MSIDKLDLKSVSEISKKLAALMGGGPKGWGAKLRKAIKKNELRCYRFQNSCNAKIWLKEQDVVNWIETICGSVNRRVVLSPKEVSEARQSVE